MSTSAAAEAFEETLASLGVDASHLNRREARSLGRRAALLAVADTVWGRHLGPVLNTHDVVELLGVSTRQAVSDRVRRHRILALPAGERELSYPAFQFSGSGTPYPVVARVLEVFAGTDTSPHTVASWFVTPQRDLDGETPAAWMADGRDDDVLVAAARRSAARVAA